MTIVASITLLLLAAIQGTWANAWQIYGVAPDLLLIATVSFGLNLGFPGGAFVGFFAGFIEGTMYGTTNFGGYILSRSLAGTFAGYLQSAFSRENSLAPVICVLGVTTFAEVVLFLMAPTSFLIDGRPFPFADWALGTVTLCALNALLMPFIHFPLTRIIRRLQKVPDVELE